MNNILNFVKENYGMVVGVIMATIVIAWAYGCQSKVTSIVDSPSKVTRSELELEVNNFLAVAELRFIDLDQQDEFKRTFFALAISFMQGGAINPAAIALVLGNILGLGAVVDNVRKRTELNSLKGYIANGKNQT